MKILLRLSTKILAISIYIVIPEITSAQWSSALNISPNALSAGLNESMGSCIGVSGSTVHVVFVDRKNLNLGAIYYTHSVDTGLIWNMPFAISDTNANAYNPAIAVNGANVHVVWRTIDTLNNHRTSWYTRSLNGGNTWSTPRILDTLIADWPAVAVSGNNVYVANDYVTAASPYNTEIFFLRSVDNGATWSPHQQLTFSVGRSEDEAITAQGADVYMAWNDNRNGQLQIFYKHSGDYGVTWDPEVAVAPPNGYGTMVNVDGLKVDIPFAGAPSGRYQIYLVQSANNGVGWGADKDLTNDTANTYYYPDMVRDGNDLHMTYVKSGVGGQYLHSGDGGATWNTPVNLGFSGITPFIAYTGCMLHIIVPDSGHINYFRNPTGNAGTHCSIITGVSSPPTEQVLVKLYPNPFTSQTTIEIPSSEERKNDRLKVFDMVGQVVLSSVFQNTNKIIIEREKLNSGIYFYMIFQKEKVIGTGKMVLQ